MVMRLNPSASEPDANAYGGASPRPRRVAVEMHQMIRRGDWPAGSQLPTTRKLAGKFNVSLSTVQAAMRELELQGLVQRRPRVGLFVAHQAASKRRGHQIALLLVNSDIESALPEGSWTQRIQQSAQQRLAEAGMQLVPVVGGVERARQWEANLDETGAAMAGAISFVDPSNHPLLEKLGRRGLPWVTITPLREGVTHNFVSADNYAGGRLVGRCFGKLGFQRCLLLGDTIAQKDNDILIKVSSRDKFHGFLQGYLDEDMPLRGIEYAWSERENRETAAYHHTLEYLDRFGPPQGIFAEGDFVALEAIRALRERGVDVPEQTSVVGGTGMVVGEYTHPALTAIGQPMEQMGRAAAGMLLEMIDRRIERMVGRYIPCRMLLRQSLRLNPSVRRLIEDEERRWKAAGQADSAVNVPP